MIILTSNGLSSQQLIQELQKYVMSGGRAAIVTTASVGYKEKDWHIPRLTAELEQLGLGVDYIDIETQNPELLKDYGVVEILGGNPFYLLKHIRLQEAEGVLQDAAANKILIGISAGSVVLQRNIELVAQYSPEMNEDVQWHDLTGLALTDIEILPHYDRFLRRSEQFEERAKAYEEKNRSTVIRINDGQGVFVKASGYYIV